METSANILIQAVGGDAAAAQINKASNALANVAKQSSGLEEKFQHKFQHIGLMLFAGEALRAAGVGAETRQVVTLLNMSLMSLGGAMGAMAGPVLLAVSALVSFVGIIEKIKDHSKNTYEELEKISQAHHKEHDETLKVTDSIAAYIAENGKAPAYLRRWQSSEEALGAAQVSRMITTERMELDAGVRMINSSRQRAEMLREEVSDQEILIEKLKASKVSQEVIIAQEAGLKKIRDEYDKQSFAVIQQKANVDKLIASLKMLRDGGTDDLDRLTKAHEKARKAAEDAAKKQQKTNEEILKGLNEQAMASYDSFEAQEKEAAKYYKQFEEHAKTAFNTINTAQSQAFAKAIVEGKSFSKQMAHIWKDMAIQIIAQIEAMITKLLLLYALEQATGMGRASAMASPAGKILGFASGGATMVNRPTLFMAGENEPESIRVVPLSKSSGSAGSGGGGGNMTVQVTNVFHGITNPDAIADVVGRKIIENIRGRGNVAFARNA